MDVVSEAEAECCKEEVEPDAVDAIANSAAEAFAISMLSCNTMKVFSTCTGAQDGDEYAYLPDLSFVLATEL